MTRSKLPAWLAIAILLPALLSLFSIYRRFQAETLNRATAFSTEFETLQALSAAQGESIDRGADELKAQGLNSVVLSEETVADLISRGRARLTTTFEAPAGPVRTGITFADPRDWVRVKRGLGIRLGSLFTPPTGPNLELPAVSPLIIRGTAIGLNPDQAAFARQRGLVIVARCSNPPGVSSKAVAETLTWAHELGATAFLPQGDQVLGRRDATDTLIDTLRSLNMLYASAEFAKIGGDDIVVRKAPDIVVRLHSAQEADLDKLSLDGAVDRYAKASRERNMRILLIRPFSYGADRPLSAFGDFIKAIHEQVSREGGAVGAPKPFGEPRMPRWYPVVIGLAILPAAWFVGCAFITDRRLRAAGGILLGLLAIASVTRHGAQAMAFVATIVFPVAAFLVLDALRPRDVLLGFFLVSLITLVGGLCVAGMLNGRAYYVMADQFLGVKISIFLPILIVGFLFLERLSNSKEVWRSPITWGTAGLGVVIVGLLAVMIARTGNDTGAGPSGGEIAFRGVLDRILYVRPRTKEFLIGHPILIVGIGLLGYLARRPVNEGDKPSSLSNWTVLLIMVGSMGQTSIVNTLTHLHIPVVLSLARVALGAVIGCIIGLVLWAIVSRLLPTRDGA